MRNSHHGNDINRRTWFVNGVSDSCIREKLRVPAGSCRRRREAGLRRGYLAGFGPVAEAHAEDVSGLSASASLRTDRRCLSASGLEALSFAGRSQARFDAIVHGSGSHADQSNLDRPGTTSFRAGRGSGSSSLRSRWGWSSSSRCTRQGTTRDSPESLEDWARLHAGIETLPDEEREVFTLTWYVGLGRVEIAELLGISPSTVKRRWRSARMVIFQHMQGVSPSLD